LPSKQELKMSRDEISNLIASNFSRMRRQHHREGQRGDLESQLPGEVHDQRAGRILPMPLVHLRQTETQNFALL
jgi:hypothetical protein